MKSLSNYLIKKSLINEDDSEIIQYGLKSIFLNGSTIISTLILAILFHNILFGILFLISFISIRTITGGYHCHSASSCFISFNIIIIILFSRNLNFVTLYHCYLLLFLLLIIPCYVHKQKNHLNKNYFNKLKVIVLFIHFIILNISNHFILPVFVSLLLNLFLLLLAYLSDYVKREN